MNQEEVIIELNEEIDELKSEIKDLEGRMHDMEVDYEEELTELRNELEELSEVRNTYPAVETLHEQEKLDLFIANFKKFTLASFEQFIKNNVK